MSRPPRRVAVLLPSIELGAYWGPVIAALDARTGCARILTARPWAGLEDDPHADLVTVVGSARRLGGGSQDAYAGGMMALPLGVVRPLVALRPDVVLVMGFSLWTVLVVLLRPLLRWRVVLMWEGSSPSVDHRGSSARTRLRRLLAAGADRLITSNDRSRSYLVDHLGVAAGRVDVHPLLVPSPERLTATPASPAARVRPALLAVGRLEPRKGLDPLLRAMGDLVDLPWSLELVGRGEERAHLGQLVDELGLGDRVRLTEWVPYGELGAHLRAADLLVFPTLEDTWGMVALEAMALGTPVLCSVHAGVSEVVRDGVDGAVVDPTDRPALVAALRDLLIRADLAGMGREAAAAVARLTPAATADALLSSAAAGRRDRRRGRGAPAAGRGSSG